ncbi:hypothetical protein [Caproiciproducens faecalis]|uniref:Uncharacterized protein n=1 Tax=Caproiciproducens faecalis TaxID=2820301 RepID=A0ABS7DMB9_9FIRM|nr:hypothetical protein [Caproiciproducens faecalis]MBW7572455.1 hypothetical protein [Caproiciproducens faecalis]
MKFDQEELGTCTRTQKDQGISEEPPVLLSKEISDDSTDLTLLITKSDFISLVKRLIAKLGLKSCNVEENKGFFALQCYRSSEEFGVGCLFENRELAKEDIEILHTVASRNYLIFTYFNLKFSKCVDFARTDIDIVNGKDFLKMVKENLNITMIR